MLISWSRTDDGNALLILGLGPADLMLVAADHVDLSFDHVEEATELHGVRIILTGPAGTEAVLKMAVEGRDSGVNVEYRNWPHGPHGPDE